MSPLAKLIIAGQVKPGGGVEVDSDGKSSERTLA